MKKYYSISEVTEILNVSAQTLRNWHKSEKFIPSLVTKGKHRYYSKEQIDMFLNEGTSAAVNMKRVFGYCRISCNTQNKELEEQIEKIREYLIQQENSFEIIVDVGKSTDYNRKGFKKLLKLITKNQVEKVVVLNKNTLLNPCFELMEYIFGLHDCSIETIETIGKFEKQEFIDDVIAMIEKMK